MADQLAVRLLGGPLNGWWITDAEPSFQYDKSLSYTFAIEMRMPATLPGSLIVQRVSMWAIYGKHPIILPPTENPVVQFNEVTWMPPTDAVVVTAVRDRPPWE